MPRVMVIDLESNGLYGEGFAVGWVIAELNAREFQELDHGLIACRPEQAGGDESGRTWVQQNVPLNEMRFIVADPKEVRSRFWAAWCHEREVDPGVLMAADVAWPVEANFLLACVADDPGRQYQAPYPLLDVASFVMAAGGDLAGTRERRQNELPAHNPLCDARQSARILHETWQWLQDAART